MNIIFRTFVLQVVIAIIYSQKEDEVCGPQNVTASDSTNTLRFLFVQESNIFDCIWRITSPLGKKVRLRVTQFKIHQNKGCKDQTLRIFDGPTEGDKLIGTVCFPFEMANFTSSGYEMLVKFSANVMSTADTLMASYSAIDGIYRTQHDTAICGEEVINVAHGKHSWKIPLNAAKAINKQCRWRLYADRGKRIRVTINEITFSSVPDCTTNRIELYEGTSETGQMIATICDSSFNTTFVSKGFEMLVKFVAYDVDAGKGFNGAYRQSGANKSTDSQIWIVGLLLAVRYIRY